VTCLAESQPNRSFVITLVSFSLLSVSEVRLYFNKELSCPHYFNKEPSCPLSISTKNIRVRSLGTLGGFPLYGQDWMDGKQGKENLGLYFNKEHSCPCTGNVVPVGYWWDCTFVY
jgi:hypothetical protein